MLKIIIFSLISELSKTESCLCITITEGISIQLGFLVVFRALLFRPNLLQAARPSMLRQCSAPLLPSWDIAKHGKSHRCNLGGEGARVPYLRSDFPPPISLFHCGNPPTHPMHECKFSGCLLGPDRNF